MSTNNDRKGDMNSILSPWVDKPAGLFYNLFVGMTLYTDFSGYAKTPPTDEERRLTICDYTTVAAFIMSGKDCLTQEVKNHLRDASYSWGAGAVSKQEIESFIENGANMTQKDCDRYIKTERKLAGDKNFDKLVLYYALCNSGIDGLNTEETIRFLSVGRHMGVPEEELNQLLIMYFHEKNLMTQFLTNIAGKNDTKSSKL